MWPAARTRVAAPRAWALIDCLQPFAPDSPVEGTGFEPSVPRQEKWSMPSSSDQTRVGRTLTLGGGAESSLEGRDIELSVSPKDIRTSPYDLCANRSDRRQSREGDRWFESTSLQRELSVPKPRPRRRWPPSRNRWFESATNCTGGGLRWSPAAIHA